MRLIITLFLIISLLIPKGVFAQSPSPSTSEIFDFRRAYQDFIFNFDLYKAANEQYEIARAQYLQSKTLAAKSKAQEATYKMLQARDEVVKTYLTALRQRISEAVGVTGDRKEVLYKKIDLEVSWYDTHKNAISSAASLEDLVQDSIKARARYRELTEAVAYEIVTEIAIGKEYFLRQKQLSVMSELNNKLGEIRSSGDFETDKLERDLLEIENRQTRSIAKEDEAKKIQATITKTPEDAAGLYSQIVFRISEALQYLKEANTYLKEIITKIKRG